MKEKQEEKAPQTCLLLDDADENLEYYTEITGAERATSCGRCRTQDSPLMKAHHAKRLDQFHSPKSYNNLN
jgi:hypothetical protein